MKETQGIEKRLKDLPKYTLPAEKQQKILFRLQQRKRYRKKNIIPAAAIIAFSCISVILGLTQMEEFSNGKTAVTESHSLQMESKADEAGSAEEGLIEGRPFILSDTKQEVIGIEGRVGILNTFDHFIAKDTKRIAKLMIFFWGNPSDLVGKQYKIEAMNQGEKITLSKGALSSELNSEDAHVLTQFEPFPREGIWELSFDIEGNRFETFSVEVLPPLPKTEHYAMVQSPKEMKIGVEADMTIESFGKDKKSIDVQLLSKDGKTARKYTYVQEAEWYDAATNHPVYIFSGKMEFPEKGIWTLKIDGEETNGFEN